MYEVLFSLCSFMQEIGVPRLCKMNKVSLCPVLLQVKPTHFSFNSGRVFFKTIFLWHLLCLPKSNELLKKTNVLSWGGKKQVDITEVKYLCHVDPLVGCGRAAKHYSVTGALHFPTTISLRLSLLHIILHYDGSSHLAQQRQKKEKKRCIMGVMPSSHFTRIICKLPGKGKRPERILMIICLEAAQSHGSISPVSAISATWLT